MFNFYSIRECTSLSTLFLIISRITLVFLFLSPFSSLNIAQTFEYLYKTQMDDISEEAVELNDKSLVLIVASGDYYQLDYQASLIKLSPEGSLVGSAEITSPSDFTFVAMHNLYQIDDTSFIATGICKNILFDSLIFVIIHFNQNLLITATSLSNFYYASSFNWGNSIYTSKNTLIAIGTDLNEYNHFIFEYDLDGNLINQNIYTDNNPSPRFANAIKEIGAINKYHLYLGGFPQDFWVIDQTSFSIDTVFDYNDTFWPWDCHNGFSDNNYFVVGRNYLGNNIKKPAILIVDNTGYVENMYTYNASPDTNSGNINKSLDVYNDKFFLAAAHNFYVTSGYPFVQQQQWIWIMRIHSDFSVQWQHFYKGDVNYMPYKILATSAGGALVLSTKYDWNDSIPYQRDVHILKIDSTGYYEPITGTSEELEQIRKQILVYPNPVTSEINFVLGLYSDLHLMIYNTIGELMISDFLLTSKTIDVSELPAGVYVYLITGKNRFIETGKFYKQDP